MATYKMFKRGGNDGRFGIVRDSDTFPESVFRYFAGYNSMGGAVFEQTFSEYLTMDYESALATLEDLRAAE